jgi:serine/threonine protein kinase
VREAHKHRIIHRDLKPANILVNSDDHPVVIDFGLARAYDVIVPDAWRVSGTLAYMSPEQISPTFGRVSEKSDAYSLGVILYELLAGHRPYAVPPDGSLTQWRQVILEAQPPRLRQYRKKYSRELEAVLTAALTKRPEDRLTVDVLRSRIAGCLHTPQRPPPGWVALGVGLVAGGMLLSTRLWMSTPRPHPESKAPIARTLAGIIRDDDHQLLAGVEVWLADVNLAAITDQHGHFAFPEVTAPPHQDVRLIARKTGYRTYEAYATFGDPAFTIIMRKTP